MPVGTIAASIAFVSNEEAVRPDGTRGAGPFANLRGLQAKVDSLKRLQAETAAELDALSPSVLERAFGGEL